MNKLAFLALLLFATAFSFAEETFAEVTYAETTYAEETFAEITYAEMTFAEEVISSSGLNLRDKHIEKMSVQELRDRYEGKYDIDWGKVAAKFGVGAAIIVITGTVSVVAGATGAEPVAAIAFASCKGAAIGAISGAVVGGGLGGLIEALKSGNLSAAQKGAIESAADGFMWGAAIGAVTGGVGKAKSVKKNPSKAKAEPVMEPKKIAQDIQSPNGIPKNTTYTVDGFVENGAKYTTDQYGRINEFSAILRKTNYNPRGSKGVEQKIGHQMKCGVGGHLIGNQFGGTGGYENLVPMSSSVNSGTYKSLENVWAKALKEGKKVLVSGKLLYSGTSFVPTEFIINYIVDGVAQLEKRIPNTCP
ncbi:MULTISPECIES: DNA/RNA non-specific endonuclease [unclassified Fibrobacter]|uniref:DNA/RNA non-specific endonuclease n=1 Tax=unclassified Fibrobacter TaxID=2634177 RepID=UPI0025C0D63C|nr:MULTISPECIES: DNA/RNA non-specific endonuclease [unclassified Fibrobacter]